jgi:hypothetical protein
VKREEKVGLGIWDRACYHCRSGRDLGSASQDGEVGGIVLTILPVGLDGYLLRKILIQPSFELF